MQIECRPALHSQGANRHSPITGVLLTNADIDHVVGLLLLRKLHPFPDILHLLVRCILEEGYSIFGMLSRVPQQARWIGVKIGERFLLQTAAAGETGISCELFSVARGFSQPED